MKIPQKNIKKKEKNNQPQKDTKDTKNAKKNLRKMDSIVDYSGLIHQTQQVNRPSQGLINQAAKKKL